MDIIQEYVVPIVMCICFCFGYVIKNYIPTDKANKHIPAIMLVLGVFMNVWLNDWSLTPTILLGGAASGLASTGVHQIIKQYTEEE